MFGRPIEGGDVLMLVVLATAVGVVSIANFARLVKPRPGFSPPPTPETIARVSRNMRVSMTLGGVVLGLGALSSLSLHRGPAWVWTTVFGLQCVAIVAMFVQIFRSWRQRRGRAA